jgi:hypothetical protein
MRALKHRTICLLSSRLCGVSSCLFFLIVFDTGAYSVALSLKYKKYGNLKLKGGKECLLQLNILAQ